MRSAGCSGWQECQRKACCGHRSFGCTDCALGLNATVTWFYSLWYSITEQERGYFASKCKQQKDAEIMLYLKTYFSLKI